MDNSKDNVLVTFSRRARSGRVYLLVLAVVAMAGVAAYLMLPAANVGTVSAQRTDSEKLAQASYERSLDYALNFDTVGDTAVYARSIRGADAGNIRGTVFDKADRDATRASKDLQDAYAAIRQLDCNNLKDTALGGKSYGPGVYCMSTSELDGELVLDAMGNANARFVFRVDGAFQTKAGASIRLENGAQSSNVYFVAGGKVSIGADSEFLGSVIAKGSISLGDGSRVEGRVYSIDGDIDMYNAVAGGGIGFIEICKNRLQANSGLDPNIAGRTYTFRVGGQVFTVQAGQCSPIIQVTAGNVTITEDLQMNSALVAVRTFSGRDGSQINNVVSVNLATQTAVIAVPAAPNETGQIIVDFENRFANIGVIEICKRAAGPTTAAGAGIGTDVSGFFTFLVYGLTVPDDPITVPVGACSPPIAVLTDRFEFPGTTPPTGPFTYVTELGRAGFTLVDIEVLQPGRLMDEQYGIGVLPVFPLVGTPPASGVFPNPGGGYAQVRLVPISTTLAGPFPAGLQTTVTFFNQANPGVLKVCKIAGPGINENVLFRFQVDGTRIATENGIGLGTPPIGFDTETFTTFVDVAAGPAAQGGNCNLVNATFVVGTEIIVTELGVSPLNTVQISPFGGTSQTLPANSTIRVSRVRCIPFACTFTRLGPVPTPLSAPVNPLTTTLPQARLNARAGTVEVEFVNFLFRPTVLKICKTGSDGTFTFTVELDPTGPFAPLFTTTGPGAFTPSTVQVRSGFCEFVSGPFPPVGGGAASATNPGTFPVGIRLRVTEAQTTPATQVTAITTPTALPNSAGTVLDPIELALRRAGVTLGWGPAPGNPNFVNEVFFNNAPAVVTPDKQAARFDFDGDRKADPSVFTPATGLWRVAASKNGGVKQQVFGQAGDKLVSADYDGDGTYDYAVWREGTWFIYTQAGGYWAVNWGQTGDVPQVGDFDGDGKADPVIWRPSTGTWWMWLSQDGMRTINWGVSTDKPYAADYDGDGKIDPTVYRSGTWYIWGSQSGMRVFDFGLPGDTVVPADFDGDFKADPTIFRNGVWYILGSTKGYGVYGFGQAGDIAVPADYTGDGAADLAVYRASEGTWYYLPSPMSASASASVGMTSLSLGGSGDIAVPAQ